jgi:hypothetical protein
MVDPMTTNSSWPPMSGRSTPTASELLVGLADELLQASRQVPDVLGGSAAPGDSIARYILAQGVTTSAEFQLPEPILHPLDNPSVLVVGFNPNFGPDEDIPRFGSSLEEYITFYADRFASHRRDQRGRPAEINRLTGKVSSIPHYNDVEKAVAAVLGTETALGLNTVYCDSIPWKWKQDKRPKKGDLDFGQASDRLERIVIALQPKVILTLGGDASGIIADWHRNKPRPRPVHPTMLVPHVASYHPAARDDAFQKHLPTVQEALHRALLPDV